MPTRNPKDGPRDQLVGLVQMLVAEGQRIGHSFAHRHGLHPTDVEALIRVMVADERGAPVTAGELGTELGLTSGTVTSLLDRLARAGHVRRERDAADRRRVIVRSGEAGMELAREFFTPLGVLHRGVIDEFTPAELEVVARYLGATTIAFRSYREQLTAERAGSS
ncbi:MarR family winged helix-turn-helix transcriptional regulator [Kribbella sp. CA-293567]|uniref:MarR family winged helix-turn-helix transcriptional regulator n=1 Tax=Kribbella sp. CA-293567 TaxID=3002436 RepID=UPI0022DD1441|nr:MarR family transcriptional regulator [Kribbella sp. CA-293567]WBQ08251.1 MarR family transcriptional regulator [Kribbella sp. CA-293567]